MLGINRTAVVVRPKQTFADWLNAHPVLDFKEHPISLEDLQVECTVLLVPDEDGSLEDALEWLQPRKVKLLELELSGWLTFEEDWPAERSTELFDEWFRLEAHSMVFDLAPDEEIYDEETDWLPSLDEETGEDEENEPSLQVLQQYTRELSHHIWMQGKSSERLEGKDARVYKAMRQHPEFHKLWDRLNQISTAELEQSGGNPLAHIHLHVAIENQLEARNPPEVEAAMRALLRHGRTRHQAIHDIAVLLADELYYMLKEGRPFDNPRYVEELNKLIKRR